VNPATIAGSVLLVVAFLFGIRQAESGLREQSEPIVATAKGEGDCRIGGEMALDSVRWSGGKLLVDATHIFAKGPYQVTAPTYTVKNTRLHIGWTWRLPPGASQAACLSGHRVHIEISDLKRAKYDIRLEPIISVK
jgi:hypothetical protein